MCFLKTLKPLDQLTYDQARIDSQPDTKEQTSFSHDPFLFSKNVTKQEKPLLLSHTNNLLLTILNMVNTTTLQLQTLEEKISQSQALMDNTFKQLNEMKDEECLRPFSAPENSDLQFGEHTHDQESSQVDPLITKIFGKKKYQYRLQTLQNIPNIIFKERNFNINVNLLDANNQKVLNSNIVHLCLGVCNSNGEWITENRASQPFMKGKTEVEMYHGESSFLKVYPRDVSRSYLDGKVNFVIYSKPSMLKFSTNASSLESVVNSSLIEPLLIKNVVIKAKKTD